MAYNHLKRKEIVCPRLMPPTSEAAENEFIYFATKKTFATCFQDILLLKFVHRIR